jgi:SpoVK/Ycf46/Vps4 family AAA+-type ATPase
MPTNSETVLRKIMLAVHGGKPANILIRGGRKTQQASLARSLATAIGFEVSRVDLNGVVSKYIGETEKNINQVFECTVKANALLFFDEADALFGKRGEVRDSHDRYVNQETNYLLTQMEAHQGISILTTNKRHHPPKTFLRRFRYVIELPC